MQQIARGSWAMGFVPRGAAEAAQRPDPVPEGTPPRGVWDRGAGAGPGALMGVREDV